jgi:hypothetical protein
MTKRRAYFSIRSACASLALLVTSYAVTPYAQAGVLPEDRGDVMYHSYDGGDVTVNGPSLLVRKKFGEKISVNANYYVDMVTSASIDVQVLGASEYKEERTQKSMGVDYLRGKTTYNFSFIDSEESDYTAQTASVGVSEDMFGDLTTISLGYTRAWDKVMKNVKVNGVLQNDGGFGIKPVDHRSYRVGVSQIVTKNLIMGLNFESQTHEGHLSNPYRAFRFLSLAGNEQFLEERYPRTRTTNAIALDARYYLPWRAAAFGSYRFFTDTWGVSAQTGEIGYVHPWKQWTFEGSFRHHRQERADFYGDLFPRPDFQNFMARDRNLSTMNDQTVHAGVSFDITEVETWTNSWLNKGSVNLFVDFVNFKYEDFRDARQSKLEFKLNPDDVGEEPLHTEDAIVIRFFVSVWF